MTFDLRVEVQPRDGNSYPVYISNVEGETPQKGSKYELLFGTGVKDPQQKRQDIEGNYTVAEVLYRGVITSLDFKLARARNPLVTLKDRESKESPLESK